MTDFKVIRTRDHRVMRWKNGGGETSEIAVSPPDAALDAFDWRLSMAKVETDGPFSAFPSVDRTLAILEGEGIRLSVGGEPAVTLTNISAPHAFAADAQASATLVNGPIRDLNMMSRRNRLAHSVTRLSGDAVDELRFSGLAMLVFCAEGRIKIDIGGNFVKLARHDTLVWTGEPLTAKLQSPDMSLIYVINLRSG